MKSAPRLLRRASMLALLSAVLAVTGCQSVIDPPKTTVDLTKEGITAINGVSRSVNSLEQSITRDPDTSAKRIAALEARLVESENRAKQVAEEANTRNEKLRQRLVETAGDFAQVASAFSGLGPIVPGLVASVKSGLETTIAKASADALSAAEKQLVTLKSELQTKEELRKKEVELARQELANLNAQQRADLHRELIAEAQRRGVEGADKMSLEQLIALLGAGGLSVTALVRTFGRSRAQDDVDELREKHESLKTFVVQNSDAPVAKPVL